MPLLFLSMIGLTLASNLVLLGVMVLYVRWEVWLWRQLPGVGAVAPDVIKRRRWHALSVILLFCFLSLPFAAFSLLLGSGFSIHGSEVSTTIAFGYWLLSLIAPLIYYRLRSPQHAGF